MAWPRQMYKEKRLSATYLSVKSAADSCSLACMILRAALVISERRKSVRRSRGNQTGYAPSSVTQSRSSRMANRPASTRGVGQASASQGENTEASRHHVPVTTLRRSAALTPSHNLRRKEMRS